MFCFVFSPLEIISVVGFGAWLMLFQTCGSPNEQDWPEVTKLPNYHMIKRNYKRRLREVFKE